MFEGFAEMLIAGLIAMVILAGIVVWAGVDYFILSDTIESPTIIIPEKRLIIKDNQVDTIYIYKSN